MPLTSTQLKIIWAVDPFDAPMTLDPAVLEAVRFVTTMHEATIEPIYVLGRIEAGPEFGVDYLVNLKPAADAAMASLVKMMNFKSLEKPVVLMQNTTSLSRSVDQLCNYATSRGASLIVVTTHARRGGVRMVLGSFAESLIARSPVDVLITRRGAPLVQSQRKILHPVDFGERSAEHFESA